MNGSVKNGLGFEYDLLAIVGQNPNARDYEFARTLEKSPQEIGLAFLNLGRMGYVGGGYGNRTLTRAGRLYLEESHGNGSGAKTVPPEVMGKETPKAVREPWADDDVDVPELPRDEPGQNSAHKIPLHSSAEGYGGAWSCYIVYDDGAGSISFNRRTPFYLGWNDAHGSHATRLNELLKAQNVSWDTTEGKPTIEYYFFGETELERGLAFVMSWKKVFLELTGGDPFKSLDISGEQFLEHILLTQNNILDGDGSSENEELRRALNEIVSGLPVKGAKTIELPPSWEPELRIRK